jgi:hypothetical protein
MEESKLLFMFDRDRQFLLSYIDNPINKHTYEMSQINLLRHRMRYIWSSINMVTMTFPLNGPDQVWVTCDYNRCFELFVFFGPKEGLENTKKNKRNAHIYKMLSEKFDDYFCKIHFDDTDETVTVENDPQFQKILKEWLQKHQQRQSSKRDNMLKRALTSSTGHKTEKKEVKRSQSVTQLVKPNDKKVHFSSPQVLHATK